MYKKKTNHIGHFILACLTGGLWVLPWILFYMVNQAHNSRVEQAHYMSRHHQCGKGCRHD